VFVDHTAVYDTAWHRGVTCKVLRLLPDRCMVHMIVRWLAIATFAAETCCPHMAYYISLPLLVISTQVNF